MARVTVVPETIDYPDSDGLPMAESESQFWPILYVGAALDRYYQARDDVYVVGNLLLYYQEGDPGKSVSPDLMVVLGASKHIRSSYRLWEEPKAPDFVLEIASESTHRIDRGEKRDLYAGMGVWSTGSTTRWVTISSRRCWAFGLSRVVICRSPLRHRRAACWRCAARCWGWSCI